MTAGIVDHEAHTRDIKRLGGLRDADADHLRDRHDRRAVDGRHPALQRLPVEGDDAGGGRAYRLCGSALGGAGRWRRWARCSRPPIPSASSATSSSARCATITRTSRTIRASACGRRRRCWRCWSCVIGILPRPRRAAGARRPAAGDRRGASCRSIHLAIWHGVHAGALHVDRSRSSAASIAARASPPARPAPGTPRRGPRPRRSSTAIVAALRRGARRSPTRLHDGSLQPLRRDLRASRSCALGAHAFFDGGHRRRRRATMLPVAAGAAGRAGRC